MNLGFQMYALITRAPMFKFLPHGILADYLNIFVLNKSLTAVWAALYAARLSNV